MEQEIIQKRQLVLRDYQIPASDFVMDNEITVLGIAPNGGKTEISIDVLCRYLNLNPKGKVLILTHSTTVLKDNYTDRLDGLDISFTYSTKFELDCQVHICLPNSEHLIKGQYDFLIVDEAHENYLANRVQRIIKNIKPEKQLLLTGTPSKFIKKGGYNIYTVAANSIPSEYFAKLQIELVASNYNWSKEFNPDYEINAGYKFKKHETKKTLDNILLNLIDRLKKGLTAEQFNNPDLFDKFKSWLYAYKKLGKTIIICRSIKQASDVNSILIDNGVNSMVSDSKTDKDSLEIINFKNNKYNVLVVVDRARLGYSDDSLYNIIDMSGTHNPNVIYQIFSRALRGTPDNQKYYLKVTTQEYGMMDYTLACVSAALMLTDNKYLSTFNGHNFNGIKIPVIKKSNKINNRYNENGSKNKLKNKRLIFPEFTNDVIDMFKNIIHDLDKPASIYKLTTIGEVRSILIGKTKPNGYWTKEKCIEDALQYNTKTEWSKSDDGSAYEIAYVNNWLDECCTHMISVQRSSGYWTFENCKEEALKYDSKSEFQQKSKGSYLACIRNKWLDKICLHMIEGKKPNSYWTKEKCIEDALQYNTKTEWSKNSPSPYVISRKNGWLGECCKHMKEVIKPNGYWTKERCKKEALKYNIISKWQNHSSVSYTKALKNEWLDECCKHMIEGKKPNGYWLSLENCKGEALKYDKISKFKKDCAGAYGSARRNGWLDECCKHMIEGRKPNNYWTKEKCIEDALKYKTKSEWTKNIGDAYGVARKNNWLDECCKHMKKIKKYE